MTTALLSLVLEATEHAHRIELIIEQKAAKVAASAESEAKALANAVTPDLQAGIEALTEKLKSMHALHEETAQSASDTGETTKATSVL